MPKTIDYKKLAAKLQAEVTKLKVQLTKEFQSGCEATNLEMEKIDLAYEKHMRKAEKEFFKKIIEKKKPKNPAAKKTAASKRKGRSAKK